MNDFRVDDIVKVIDGRENYPDYLEWVGTNVFKYDLLLAASFANRGMTSDDTLYNYKVRYIAPHSSKNDKTLYYIQQYNPVDKDYTGVCFLVNRQAIKLTESISKAVYEETLNEIQNLFDKLKNL